MGSGDGLGDKYDHEHALEECAEYSDRHKQFIKDNLQAVKKQCKEFKVCLNELYSQENIHLILQGGDIDLRLICGFLYPDTTNTTTASSQCQDKERKSIKEDVSKKLKDSMELEGDHHDGENEWQDVKDCLHNETMESHNKPVDHLDQICRLADRQEEDICNSRVHHRIESFLNHQLEHIQCTCNSLKKISPRFPFRYRAAIGAGGLLFIILLIVTIICCCKRRKKNKKKRKLREESLMRVNYHLSRASGSREQLEITEDPYSEPIYNKSRGTVPVKPPELPPRYSKYPQEGKKDSTHDYLLPDDLPRHSPVPDKSILTSERRGADGASIEDISGRVEMPRPAGYDPLGPRDKENEYSVASDMEGDYRPVPESEQDYSKAGHIDDPTPKNTYFVLEDDTIEQLKL
ncbi:hypothetical protein LOTGIDRAFT_169111 [Lottia gigantea]|uniref:Uncharacterized protein n=1 Tax=Lottia gigantea TaxID=225164 RepID=V3ZHF8_LOTGI|nr:hypothetical protein LOTGIDRAFT_169111 [Lottia gigantea]ESO83637.1 hypothetical protein LOTGIDRAFT_169111 [Lottia gigantea]